MPGGGAEIGDDYVAPSEGVTIPLGAYFSPVTVTPHDDFLVEGAELVIIALQQLPVFPPPYVIAWPSEPRAALPTTTSHLRTIRRGWN